MNTQRLINFVKLVIPEDYRESCIGDLYEIQSKRNSRTKAGKNSEVYLVYQTCLFLLAGLRMRLDDSCNQLPLRHIFFEYRIKKSRAFRMEVLGFLLLVSLFFFRAFQVVQPWITNTISSSSIMIFDEQIKSSLVPNETFNYPLVELQKHE
jgi:hypothetical protein